MQGVEGVDGVASRGSHYGELAWGAPGVGASASARDLRRRQGEGDMHVPRPVSGRLGNFPVGVADDSTGDGGRPGQPHTAQMGGNIATHSARDNGASLLLPPP